MAAETPGSPEDYSLFLSENGHLSFENPNYQVNKSLPDIREPTLTSLKTQYFLIVSSSYALGLIFLLKIVISTERWPAYLSAISGVGSCLGRFLEVAPLQILCCILFHHITSHVISFSSNPRNFTFVIRAIWDNH